MFLLSITQTDFKIISRKRFLVFNSIEIFSSPRFMNLDLFKFKNSTVKFGQYSKLMVSLEEHAGVKRYQDLANRRV